MAGATATAFVSSVGAGVSQVRYQTQAPQAQLKDQKQSEGGLSTVALQLIQSALSVAGATGRDLDVLA